MRQIFYFSLLGLAGLTLSLNSCGSTAKNARSTAAATADSYAPTPEENALLWEISGKGLKEPSYLFGTIHLIGREDFFLTDEIEQAFEQVDQVAFEIDIEDMMDFSNMMPLLMKAFMSNGATLSDLLSEEDYQLVQDHFQELGLPMMFLDRIKPLFLSALDPESGGLTGGGGSMASYELEFMEMAKKQNKPIEGLETAEFQMSMFDSIPYQAQAEMLVESIKSSTAGNDEMAKMVEMYKNQDIVGMVEIAVGGEGGIGEYEDLLLGQRNRNWIPVMGQLMSKNRTFFAVGAGHLAGEQGVIALLRRAGYRLQPIRNIPAAKQ